MNRLILIAIALGCSVFRAEAQQSAVLPSTDQIRQIVQEVARYQEGALLHEGTHFRYRTHRVDPKEDTTRDLIETSEGNVARLVLHNGLALTTDENDGERHRLNKLLESGDLRRKQKDEQRNRTYGVELIRAMPDAMLYSIAPGQPQLPNVERKQLVLDFSPNPAFHARTVAEGLMDGMAGRIWIDHADHHLVRIEIRTIRDLNLAWGMLVKVYKGGTIEYDQQRLGEGVYCFSHVRTSLRLREFMVKNSPYESDLTAFQIRVLPQVPTGAEAIRTLLTEPVATR